MDIKQIQELVRTVNKSEINELSIEQKDFKITIKKSGNKGEAATQIITGVPIPQQILPPVAYPAAAQPAQQPSQPQAAPADQNAPAKKTDNTVTIKSPMIGTFYRQAGPDKPLLASVGDVIEKGQVVCVIEAMKLFNEIESEVSGKIVQVLVEDASPVEFDQPLFLVEP